MTKEDLTEKLQNVWIERWRPSELKDLVSEEALKTFLQKCIDKQDIPNLLFYGAPGTGKNSIINVLINNIDCNYVTINASSETSIDVIREKVEAFANTSSWGNKLKVCILNEIEGISYQAQKALKEVMETTLTNCRYILTSNEYNKINPALISRCTEWEVKPPKDEIEKRLVYILDSEGVVYTYDYIQQIVKKYHTNIRKMIGESYKYYLAYEKLDSNCITLSIDDKTKEYFDTVFNTSDVKTINELTKKFTFDEDVYAMMKDYCAEKYNDPMLIISICDYAYKSKIVNDKDLCLMSCILEISEIVKQKR